MDQSAYTQAAGGSSGWMLCQEKERPCLLFWGYYVLAFLNENVDNSHAAKNDMK